MILLLLLVTVCPAMAAKQIESQLAKNPEKYSAELQVQVWSGQPMNLATISNLLMFSDAHIESVDVILSSPWEQRGIHGRIVYRAYCPPYHRLT